MADRRANPILQFGTSRFLQAHVDLFVSEALERGEALGGITVVQSTQNPASSQRTQAFCRPEGYPVVVRGLSEGQAVTTEKTCRAIRKALNARTQWDEVRADMCNGTAVVISNTGDSGWLLHEADGPHLLATEQAAPESFPAKLLVLLHDRWQHVPQHALTVLPCELVANNGDQLHATVDQLAAAWQCDAAFLAWLSCGVVWGNSLVDRIVSEALEPVGAVAEPYALWAVENQPGLQLPCRHPDIVLTDNLAVFEKQKLHVLNLGHTVLADLWLKLAQDANMTVLQAMQYPVMRDALEYIWQHEVWPVFDAVGQGAQVQGYIAQVRDRLLNPFLAHRLADIAQNHALKKQRRIGAFIQWADSLGLSLAFPRLQQVLQDTN